MNEITHNFISVYVYIYIYYIPNKVLHFSSHANVNVNKGICLIAVFSVINVVIRGAEKETMQQPEGLLK